MELFLYLHRKKTKVKLLGLKHLTKLKKKNRGNAKLQKAVDELIEDIKKAQWKTKEDVLKDRIDADCVHSDGYYFFNIHIHRTMVLIEYQPADAGLEEKGVANVLWAESHEEYERTFKNNKKVIEKWLRSKGLIE